MVYWSTTVAWYLRFSIDNASRTEQWQCDISNPFDCTYIVVIFHQCFIGTVSFLECIIGWFVYEHPSIVSDFSVIRTILLPQAISSILYVLELYVVKTIWSEKEAELFENWMHLYLSNKFLSCFILRTFEAKREGFSFHRPLSFTWFVELLLLDKLGENVLKTIENRRFVQHLNHDNPISEPRSLRQV